MNQAIAQGNNVNIKFGEYTLSSDILLHNKKNARVITDGALIRGNGKKIIIKGDNYTSSQNNILSGLEIVNGTVRIENSFKTTITDMVFRNCTTAIELVNTKTWSECTTIENCYFKNCSEGIVFRTPIDPGTGFYANTEISRCYFELSVIIRWACGSSRTQNSRAVWYKMLEYGWGSSTEGTRLEF